MYEISGILDSLSILPANGFVLRVGERFGYDDVGPCRHLFPLEFGEKLIVLFRLYRRSCACLMLEFDERIEK